MKLDIKILDGQFCKARFCISADEIEKLFLSFGLSYDDFNDFKNDVEKKVFYEFIQDTLIINGIISKGLTPIKTCDYYYYNKLKKAMPLFGIVFFIITPSELKLPLPKIIPNYINDKIIKFEDELNQSLNDINVKSAIGKCLVDLGLYSIIESDSVLETSTVYYDLVKRSKDSNDIDKVQGLVINMELENGSYLSKMLLNAKAGDVVIVSESDEVLEIHINKIIDKLLYTDTNYDKIKLDKYSFGSISELVKAFIKAEVYKYRIETYLTFISKYIYELNVIEIKDRAFDFYCQHYIENNLVHDQNEEDLKIRFVSEFFQRYIDSKISMDNNQYFFEHQIEFLNIKTNPLFFYFDVNLLDRLEMYDYFAWSLFLKYFNRKKLIKGINLN